MKFIHLRLLILGVCLAFYAQTHCHAQTQPNVVLILSDDQAWTDTVVRPCLVIGQDKDDIGLRLSQAVCRGKKNQANAQ